MIDTDVVASFGTLEGVQEDFERHTMGLRPVETNTLHRPMVALS